MFGKLLLGLGRHGLRTCRRQIVRRPRGQTYSIAQRWSSAVGTGLSEQNIVAPTAPNATVRCTTSLPDAAEPSSNVLSADDLALIMNALRHPEQQKGSVMGGSGIGTKHGDMLAAFTCGRCDHRTVKRFSKHAYTKGIVIVECPSCHVKHLLADHLGWLEDKSWTIEDLLKERKENFVRLESGDYVSVTPGDVQEDGTDMPK